MKENEGKKRREGEREEKRREAGKSLKCHRELGSGVNEVTQMSEFLNYTEGLTHRSNIPVIKGVSIDYGVSHP